MFNIDHCFCTVLYLHKHFNVEVWKPKGYKWYVIKKQIEPSCIYSLLNIVKKEYRSKAEKYYRYMLFFPMLYPISVLWISLEYKCSMFHKSTFGIMHCVIYRVVKRLMFVIHVCWFLPTIFLIISCFIVLQFLQFAIYFYCFAVCFFF